ncbi:unnamed protein product [Polarella glacialis]|uniref:Sugar phosphate transporter domain-containing protein n=1 Tax=Polarella glacialis TaxID=89957 RepID=A0A813GFV8_POLGL|nr:unnamed protein product [Polarella glacialis]
MAMTSHLHPGKMDNLGFVGKLTIYFGAQTGMNLYMKAVLSHSIVDGKGSLLNNVELHHNLEGVPAAFALTALQQVTAFFLFMVYIGLSHMFSSNPYTPKKLKDSREWFAVILFSLSFTLNIALNNFSMSLISLSVNLIIRSCLPLSTFISQQVAARCTGEKIKDCKLLEIALMLMGVTCAAVAVIAKTKAAAEGPQVAGQNDDLVYGVTICILSLFSGSINLALAGVLGTSVSLNSLDTTVYMAVPATLFLIPVVFFYQHPIKNQEWQLVMGGRSQLTDWEVFSEVCRLSPGTMTLSVLSGVFALGYNVLQYNIVQTLSATHTAFAGNFNKAATIFLAILVGLEAMPQGYWGIVMLSAVLGNILSFTGYNLAKIKGGGEIGHAHGHGSQSVPLKTESVEDDDGEDESVSSNEEEESACGRC